MPTQSSGGGDSFSMRARAAALRVQDPSLQPEEAGVLAQKQYTEQENARQAAATPGLYPTGRPGGIDVNSYRGSMFAPAGSPTAARPAPAPGLYPNGGSVTAPGAIVPGLYANTSFERSATRLLRNRFGGSPLPSQPGERAIDVSTNDGNFSVPAPGLYGSAQPAAVSGQTTTTGLQPTAPAAQPSANPAPTATAAAPQPAAPTATTGGLYQSVLPSGFTLPPSPTAPAGSVDELLNAKGVSTAAGLYNQQRQQTLDSAALAGHAAQLGETNARTSEIHAKVDRDMRNAKAWAAAVKANGDPEADPVAIYQQNMGDDVGHIAALRKEKPPTFGDTVQDPVTGERVTTFNGQVVKLGNANAPKKPSYPRDIDAGGGKTVREIAPGKFADPKTGTPVEWKGDRQEKPLTVNEFLMSPVLSEKFGNDYGKYREAHATASKQVAPQTPGATTAPASTGPTLADVQAEIARRKAGKK